MTLKQIPRIERALLRAGSPYISDYGKTQLVRARRGECLSTGADGRYYLRMARSGGNSFDPLRVHIRQRAYKLASRLIVAESLRQLVQGIADAGNRPAQLMLLAMDSGTYHGPLAGNHYAYREKEGLISYCPAGRTQIVSESGRWERAGRQETTPARWVRSVLKEARVKLFRDHELAEFTEKFKAAELSGKVTLEESTDFEAAYKSANYTGTEASAMYSCMWDDPVQGFYKAAPCVALIAKRGDGKYLGRALLWHDVQGTGGARFMDRVYSSSPEIRELFRDYAKAQGAWCKDKDSASCRMWRKPDGTSTCGPLMVEYNNLESVGFYPYMDTFSFSEGNTLCTSDDGEAEYSYYSTSGDREELHQGKVQLESGIWVDEEEACEVNGSWYHQDDCVMCERSGEYIHYSESFTVRLSRNNTITIHREHVTDNS